LQGHCNFEIIMVSIISRSNECELDTGSRQWSRFDQGTIAVFEYSFKINFTTQLRCL